jgi:hypothetical protein
MGIRTSSTAVRGLVIMPKKSTIEKNISPEIICAAPWRLAKVKPLGKYRLAVEFNDGTCGLVDMEGLIMSKKAGVFAILRDPNQFDRVYINYGTAVWPSEIDLAPDTMYDEIKKQGKCVFR